jgi:hypothetical protein
VGNRVALCAVLVAGAVACSRSDLGLLEAPGGSAADASAPSGDAARDAASTGDTGAPRDARPGLDGPLLDAGVPPDGGTAAGCGPTRCGTCCLPDGTCAPVDDDQACGYGGQACVVCPPGSFCKGACFQFQDNCGPGNCAGCCGGVDLCASGTGDVACGSGGEQCQRCVPQEGTGQCEPLPHGGGLCNATPSCTPGNCTGCCAGDVCLVGDTESACGSNGSACAACPAGQACESVMKVGYACVAAPCDPSTCTGCCDGLVCAMGDQDIACGSGGAACTDCVASGRACVQGACR